MMGTPTNTYVPAGNLPLYGAEVVGDEERSRGSPEAGDQMFKC